jgi:hypothetical protein
MISVRAGRIMAPTCPKCASKKSFHAFVRVTAQITNSYAQPDQRAIVTLARSKGSTPRLYEKRETTHWSRAAGCSYGCAALRSCT